MQINALYVIVKLAERCNLNCSYCYYYTPANASVFERASLMKATHLSDLVKYVADAVESHGIRRVVFAFHGGEPTLADPAITRAFCKSVREQVGGLCQIDFALQTNGVFLPDDWLTLIEEERMSVGVSIDGDKSVHDKYRVDHRGRGSYDRVRKSLAKLLTLDEDSKIRLSILVVMGEEFAGVDTYRMLVDGLGVRRIKPLFVDRTADDQVDPQVLKKLGKHLCDMFDSWLENDSSRVEIPLFASIVRETLAKTHKLRGTRDRLTFGLAFLSDGRVRISDDFMVAERWFDGQHALYAATSKFSDFVGQPHMIDVLKGQTRPPTACASCTFSEICAGGEIPHRYRDGLGFDNPSVYCQTLYMLHSHIQRRLELGSSYLATVGVDKSVLVD